MTQSANPASFVDHIPGHPREFPFTADDFQRIAAILLADTGITLSEVKAPLVYSRLVKRVRDLGLRDFKAYCALVADTAGAEERQQLLAALTTNITRFFREPHHFEHLRTQVLPQLVAEAQSGGRVRLWSAGCSSGEEPYSIAMTLLSMLPDAEQFDVKILAVDIDAQMLARGRAGVYSHAAIEAVEPAMREAWFVPEIAADGKEVWRAAPALRKLVTFRRLNLVGEWPMRGGFQAIFCRNTVIYFEEAAQRRVWAQMADVCVPGGTLYTGHSERLAGTDLFKPAGVTTYLRKDNL